VTNIITPVSELLRLYTTISLSYKHIIYILLFHILSLGLLYFSVFSSVCFLYSKWKITTFTKSTNDKLIEYERILAINHGNRASLQELCYSAQDRANWNQIVREGWTQGHMGQAFIALMNGRWTHGWWWC